MRTGFLIAALALAGCHPAAEKQAAQPADIDLTNASMAQVSGLLKSNGQSAAQPGMWTAEMKILSVDVGLPAGADRDAQIAAIKSQEASGSKCQAAGDAKPVDLASIEKAAGTCTFPHYVAKGGKVDIAMRCTQPSSGTTEVNIRGTSTTTAFDVVVDQQSGTRGQPDYLAVKLRAKGSRTGACAG
ncbi:MAG: DUF3617 family protein [Sphingomonas sp.]